MQRAKRNVEQHYSVVGVLEDMDITLQVLEGYIPRFFRNARQTYYGEQNAKLNPTKIFFPEGI